MLSLGIWILGLALIGLVLARACAQRLVFAYPIFYTYLAFVLFTSLGLLFIYWRKHSEYSRYYWYVEFAGAALGCGVVWEIYRHALGRFPGAARMARNALLFTLALTVSKAIANASTGLGWWPTKTLVALERDLRTVQAAVLVGLAIIIASYAIPLGRNLWGMMAGYALLISTNVITLTLSEHLGSGFYTTWRYLQPLAYVTALSIWCATLWSYGPVPAGNENPRIEQDYQTLVQVTTKGFLHARTYLRKAFRP